MRASRFFPVLALWLLGGALNAAHCYFLPFYKDYDFQWHVIPAGALHGLVLAAVPFLFAEILFNKNAFLKILGIFAAGYLAGWISGIFLGFSLEGKWTLARLWWPVRYGISAEDSLMSPFTFFGCVGSLYYSFLIFLKKMKECRLGPHILAGCTAGIAGSMWFWASTKPLYISLLHGAIWGVCTGLGAWVVKKENS